MQKIDRHEVFFEQEVVESEGKVFQVTRPHKLGRVDVQVDGLVTSHRVNGNQ